MFRFRTRFTTMICAGLLLLGMLAIPAQAGPGGNRANAAVCANGGYRYLADADGNPFRNAGQCLRHVARSSATITVTGNTVRGSVNDFLVSGSGFLANASLSVRFATDTGVVAVPPDPYTTDASGNFANPFSWTCSSGSGSVNYIAVSDGANTAHTTQEVLCQ